MHLVRAQSTQMRYFKQLEGAAHITTYAASRASRLCTCACNMTSPGAVD
jgi:hypothetical protein